LRAVRYVLVMHQGAGSVVGRGSSRPNPSRTAVSWLAAALLVGLAGCSGSGDPGADPSTPHAGTAPPSPTASSTPTQDAGQAAIAAVQRMFAAYNAMLKSGSSKAYRATFTKACVECASDAAAVEAIWRRGRTVRGGNLSVTSLRLVGVYLDLRLTSVQGTVGQRAISIMRGHKVVDSVPAFSGAAVVWNVSEVGGTWLVSRATIL
jgi:hypothetical protein